MKNEIKTAIAVTTLLSLISIPLLSHALEQGDWTLRAGATGIYPDDADSDPVTTAATGSIAGTAVGASSAWSLGLTIGYAFTSNWGIELLAAWPFTHDIEANQTLRNTLAGLGLSGSEVIGEVEQLPPTLSITYTFQPGQRLRPYIGAGINYWTTTDEEVKGDLATAGYTNLDVDSSWGIAVQAGLDYDLSDRVFLNASIRWIDIETDATITGPGALGPITVNNIALDPWVYSVFLGTTF
jgi:outer membrane protein